MIIFYIMGGLLTLVGIGLFIWEQTKDQPVGAASAGAMGFSYSGPPAVILILLGLAVTFFPHSPWAPEEKLVALPTTTTTTTTPTTTTTTTVPFVDPRGFPPDFPVYEFVPDGFDLIYPSAPYDVRLAGDGERLADGHEPDPTCTTTPAIAWTPGEANLKVDWFLEIDAYDGDVYVNSETWDSAFDEWVFGWTPSGQAWPGWCFWDLYDSTLSYDVWIYAYNENGISDPGYILIEP